MDSCALLVTIAYNVDYCLPNGGANFFVSEGIRDARAVQCSHALHVANVIGRHGSILHYPSHRTMIWKYSGNTVKVSVEQMQK